MELVQLVKIMIDIQIYQLLVAMYTSHNLTQNLKLF